MSTEIVVNVSPRETRAALLENGVLQELFVERASRRGLVGNIYKGRVSRVLPGMQAAFIDIGLERTAFLHVSDIVQPADAEGAGDAPRTDSIRELVGEGDDLLVQVLKDPLGTKGARLTTFVTIPSRYLVYMPFGHGVGVSARIENEAERQRLRDAMQAYMPAGGTGGYIVRTAAEGATGEALRADMLFLRKLWDVLTERARGAAQGALVHEDLPLPLRLMRDLRGRGRGPRAGRPRAHLRADARVRRARSCRGSRRASSATPAAVRSSTCTASRTRSSARSTARCRSSRAAT